MKRRGFVKGIMAVVISAMVMTGCGSSSSSKDYATESMYAEPAAAYGVYDNMAEEAVEFKSESGESAPEVSDSSRKLITTVNLTSETEDLDVTIANVESKVNALGGYIESSNIYNGSTYMGSSSRNADLRIRIPAAKLGEFVEMVEGSTNITRKSTNVEDVTLQYVDIASKKNALKTEETRLLDILRSAETVEDLIAVEDKLADVRYELESIESQLRSYDNQVDYSTVYLTIEEVVKFTPVEKEGAFSRMGKGFMENLSFVGESIVEAFVWLVSHLPQILLTLLVVFAIVMLIKKISDNSRKKRIAKAAAMMQMAPGAMAMNSQKPANSAPPVNNATDPEKKDDGNKQ